MTRYAIQLADFMALRQHDPALGIVLAANAERQSVQIGKERFDEIAKEYFSLRPRACAC